MSLSLYDYVINVTRVSFLSHDGYQYANVIRSRYTRECPRQNSTAVVVRCFKSLTLADYLQLIRTNIKKYTNKTCKYFCYINIALICIKR
jgi:hypothetical protein